MFFILTDGKKKGKGEKEGQAIQEQGRFETKTVHKEKSKKGRGNTDDLGDDFQLGIEINQTVFFDQGHHIGAKRGP